MDTLVFKLISRKQAHIEFQAAVRRAPGAPENHQPENVQGDFRRPSVPPDLPKSLKNRAILPDKADSAARFALVSILVGKCIREFEPEEPC